MSRSGDASASRGRGDFEVSFTIAELQDGFKALTDLSSALSTGLQTATIDEEVIGDAAEIAGVIDPELVPFTVLLPVVEFMVLWLIANNKLRPQRMATVPSKR